jgi:hypothetical protein
MVFDSENNAKMYTPNRTARKCHDVLFVTSIVKTTELLRKKVGTVLTTQYQPVF